LDNINAIATDGKITLENTWINFDFYSCEKSIKKLIEKLLRLRLTQKYLILIRELHKASLKTSYGKK